MEEIITKNQTQHQEYVCSICYQLSHDAVQANCCHKTYCEKCAQKIQKKKPICPYCRKLGFQYKVSDHRETINNIKLPCGLCKQIFLFHEIPSHLKNCDMNEVVCRFCKQISNRKEIVKHTYEFHQNQIQNIVKQYQFFGAFSVNYQNFQNKVSLNQRKSKVHLGTSGKIYCGGLLQGNCSCCNGYCGPTNGQNCRACMKLDLKRRGMPKGYLINADNRVCWQTKVDSGIFICGSMQGWSYMEHQQNDFCTEQKPCYRCASTAKSAQLRYSGLF